ncbi:MAG: transporter substrate-binding domain-containing protein [Bifidobacteriaceae bacterium]|jgi:putative lysine transport system substrate-binding protein|nr:transporter substrate-binding domain-containing protein [Bifidobacteriaceae bacterium]
MNSNRFRVPAITAALLAGALALAGCGGSDNPGGEGGAAPLRVGMEAAYAPFNWTQVDDANGAVAIDGGGWAGGYDVQIAKLIGEALGREVVVVKTQWDGLTPALTSGKIDLIIAGMSPTEERRQAIDFTDYYYTSDIVLVLRQDSPFAAATSIRDFAGAKVTGQLGTIHYGFIDQLAGADKQPAMEDFPAMIVAVNSGKVDAYVSERPGALSAVASNPDLTFLGFEGDDGFQVDSDETSISIGLPKGSDLAGPINEALAGISEETRAQIMADAVAQQPGD